MLELLKRRFLMFLSVLLLGAVAYLVILRWQEDRREKAELQRIKRRVQDHMIHRSVGQRTEIIQLNEAESKRFFDLLASDQDPTPVFEQAMERHNQEPKDALEEAIQHARNQARFAFPGTEEGGRLDRL